MKRLALLLLAVAGCSAKSQIALQYQLVGLQPGEVYRLDTMIAVDPSDPRNFFAKVPFTQVAEGIGYEVRDFDGSGKLRMMLTHDVTLGYTFSPSFVFTLLPPSDGAPPPLVLVARAIGTSDHIGSSGMLRTTFAEGRSLAVPVMDLRCNGVACDPGQICCQGACTDTAADVANCGACDQACGAVADTCALGKCRCGSGSACTAAQTCCSGLGCVDLSTSPFNCGACGTACNPGEKCEGGTCKCGSGTACNPGGLCCSDGTCSMNATCPCGMGDCSAPNLCCDAVAGTCVDVRTDQANCGSCGAACAAPLSCQNGACTCQGQICGTGDTCCQSGCANLTNDGANCGTCGHACAANEVCSGGECKCGATQCNAGQACCGGACIDPDGDFMNCGGCGIVCNPGEGCVGGMCQCPGTNPVRACAVPPESCCGSSGTSGGGGCFDLTSSHDHCGACGIACNANEQCQSSHCVVTSCEPPCDHHNMCVMGACKCNGGNPCSDNSDCCGAGCTDTRTDPNNCGNCGTACTSTQLCCGSCVARDAAHCQSCDLGCPTAGRAVFCCKPNDAWQCTPESVLNCGGCGKTCTAGQVCCPPSSAGPGGNTTSTCKQESDFACGPNCVNCNAGGGVCCNHQCCNGLCLLSGCVL